MLKNTHLLFLSASISTLLFTACSETDSDDDDTNDSDYNSGYTSDSGYVVNDAFKTQALTENSLSGIENKENFVNATNLVSNPSFELNVGSPTYWTRKSTSGTFSSEVATFTAKDGANVAKFTTLTTSITGREVRSKCFVIDGTKDFYFNAALYTPDSVANTKGALAVYYFKNSACTTTASTAYAKQTASKLTTSSSWQTFTHNQTAANVPDDATYAYVSLSAQYVSGSGSSASKLYFDKVEACAPDTYYRDSDGDGYGVSSATTQACTKPTGYSAYSTDCDDTNATIHPNADEVNDGLDTNCDGELNLMSIASGGDHSLVLRENGSLWMVGSDSSGQLGNSGYLSDESTPFELSSISSVASISGGGAFSLVSKTDGTVWAWGDNEYGQVGDGTVTDKGAPVQSLNVTTATSVAAGYYHSLALKSAGTVMAWGRNSYGQIGDGTTTDKVTAVSVTSLSNVVKVAAGWEHSLAVKNDGTLWTWGYNDYGQIGDGTTTNRSNAVQVTSLSNVVSAGGGCSSSIALKNNGTVWTWGYNDYGQIGDGTTTDRKTPVQVTTLTNITAVVSAGFHSLALKNDGTVWAWGFGIYGELGDGSNAQRLTPVQALNVTPSSAIAGGTHHSLSIKTDNTVWAWGENTNGQLGDGTTTDRSSAVLSGF